MDLNSDTVGSSIYPGYPVGLGPVLSREQMSPQGYNGMTETEKEHLILQCKDAKTADAKDRIVDALTSDMDAKALAEETAQ